jgi:hypothetical protein
LRRLGFDAWLVEDLDDATAGRRAFFEETTRRHGLESRSLLITPTGAFHSELDDLAADAALLVNISGNLRDPALIARFARRAYIDLDPGFTQIWHEQGRLGDHLVGYDRYFTVALNVGAPDCLIPGGGIDWVPLPPPVVLAEWQPATDPQFDRFTTVATWRNAFGPLEFGGRSFTLKHHEFRRFADVPLKAGAPFEVALDIHPVEIRDRDNLRARGWKLVDPREVAGDPDAFRDYVRGSGGEFSVTQGIYAQTRSGWVSDRTAHYLAAGRPAIVQETGVPAAFRVEAGMLTFSDVDGAVAAAERVIGSYPEHAAAARRFAEEHFDSDRVLSRMLETVGVE